MPQRITQGKQRSQGGRKLRRPRGEARVGRSLAQSAVHRFLRSSNCSNTGVGMTWAVSSLNGNESVVNSNDGVTLETGTGNTSFVTYYSFSYYTTLGFLADYTDFTNLFDQYKIDRMSLELRTFATQATTATTGALINMVVDHDDAGIPAATDAGIQLLREYPTYKVANFVRPDAGKQFVMTCVPRVAVAAYAGAFTSYANVASWIDAASPSVQHYGFKGVIEVWCPTPGTSVSLFLRPMITCVVSCRETR